MGNTGEVPSLAANCSRVSPARTTLPRDGKGSRGTGLRHRHPEPLEEPSQPPDSRWHGSPVSFRSQRPRVVSSVFCNAQMTPRDLRRHCALADGADQLLETAMTKLGLSARAYTSILKVARAITDLDQADAITSAHVSEAIQYRSLDRSFH